MARGEDDESTASKSLTMAQAALLNMRGAQVQAQLQAQGRQVFSIPLLSYRLFILSLKSRIFCRPTTRLLLFLKKSEPEFMPMVLLFSYQHLTLSARTFMGSNMLMTLEGFRLRVIYLFIL